MDKAAVKDLLERIDIWLLIFGFIVVVGVGGESFFGIRHWWNSRKLQRIEESEEKEREARIAALNQDAAALRKEAEAEKLARVKLEKEIAPRTLDDPTRKKIGDELSKFAKHFSGRKVKVSSYSADAEGIVFSLEILDVMTKAGIDTEPLIGRLVPVGLVDLGVKITGPAGDEEFVRSLATAIHSHLVKEVSDVKAEWDPKYTELTILVGVKPVAGLPRINTTASTPPASH